MYTEELKYFEIAFVAYPPVSFQAPNLESAWEKACSSGLDGSGDNYQVWLPRWQVDEPTLEGQVTDEVIQEAIKEATNASLRLASLTNEEDYGDWYPCWQPNEDNERKDRYDPEERREYMRTYRGFRRGTRDLEFKEKYPHWRSAISVLSLDWQNIVTLYYIKGMTDDEIGEHLATFHGSSKSPSRQAIAKRRKKAVIEIAQFHEKQL